jgi:F-type H+-transporting ATPase subunit delta
MAEDRVNAYASALLEVARAEGNLERVEAELYEIARVIERSDDLRARLTDQALPVDVRQGIIEDLLQGRAQPTTIALVSFVVGSGRGRDLPAIVNRMMERAASERSEALAEVTSAIPLNEEQLKRLGDALSKRTGQRVSVRATVDPSVLGGLIVTIGDTVIDGSVRRRLEQLRETL